MRRAARPVSIRATAIQLGIVRAATSCNAAASVMPAPEAIRTGSTGCNALSSTTRSVTTSCRVTWRFDAAPSGTASSASGLNERDQLAAGGDGGYDLAELGADGSGQVRNDKNKGGRNDRAHDRIFQHGHATAIGL